MRYLNVCGLLRSFCLGLSFLFFCPTPTLALNIPRGTDCWIENFQTQPTNASIGGFHIMKGTVEPVADPVTNRMLWVVELEVPFILQGAIPGSHIPPVWLLPPALSCHSVSRICRAPCPDYTRLTGGFGHPTHQILAIALVFPPGHPSRAPPLGGCSIRRVSSGKTGSRGRIGKSPIGLHTAIRVASLPLAA